ncbi:MAG: OmpH family outer membrane protein, partial [Aliifodinibius sp.]|nr:OmpH family outer membrane protein [Fodinibius sp.]NIV15695.1 OmpH family outer membrane protein [Fodinibius sp.]NIY26809.1 OmpH family outer membrane protein [Fodinibius sp.]
MVSHTAVACFLLMICASITAAQDQKIGYVNTDQILSQMSEYEGIQEQLSTISSEWNKQLDKMEQEIEQ